MIRWVKLSESLNSDPAFRALSRAARGVYAQLLLAADPATGAVLVVAGMTFVQTVALIAWSPGDTDAERAVATELSELTSRGHVVLDEPGRRMVIPAHPARAGASALGSMGVSGPGARGGKSPAERQRDRRERQRADRDSIDVPVTEGVTEPVTGGVTDPTCDASRSNRDGRHGQTVTVTEPVTGSREEITTENSGETPPVTESSHSVTSLEKKREEKRREEQTLLPSVGEVRAGEPAPGGRGDDSDGAASPKKPATPRRKVQEPELPDAPPAEGTLARRVYDAIVGDAGLRPIVDRPGDFAARITTEGAYPGLNVLAQVLRAGEWLSRQRGMDRWRDGRAGLSRWLAREAGRMPGGGSVAAAPVAAKVRGSIDELVAKGQAARAAKAAAGGAG